MINFKSLDLSKLKSEDYAIYLVLTAAFVIIALTFFLPNNNPTPISQAKPTPLQINKQGHIVDSSGIIGSNQVNPSAISPSNTNNNSNGSQPYGATNGQSQPNNSTPAEIATITNGSNGSSINAQVTDTSSGFIPKEVIYRGLEQTSYSITIDNKGQTTPFLCADLNLTATLVPGINNLSFAPVSGIHQCTTNNSQNILTIVVN